MPIIDEKRIFGNYGTHLVAHLLSNFCLVRPVAEGTDIGIDLYCETIEEGEGFLHFWAQVKCGVKKITVKNGKASYPFSTDHLRYWDRQPVPVFAFFVKLDKPSFSPKYRERIFVADLSEYLMTSGIPETKFKTIESNFEINTENDEWRKDFLSRLEATTSLLKLRDDGITTSLPELKPGYVQSYLYRSGLSKYVEKSLRTIRSTVSAQILDAALLKHHESIDPSMNYFDPLIKILRIFEQGKRPEIMVALSLWMAIIEGKANEAIQMINIAIESINSDEKLDKQQKKSWCDSFIPIRNLINELGQVQSQNDL